MKILVTIAARGGSKSIPGKNIKTLLGKPLIGYTIEQALRWGRFDALIVSTDSKEIADIAKKFGADAPFIRPQELSGDEVGKLDVLRHALKESENHYKEIFDIIIDLDVTSPVRTTEDIDNMVTMFEEKKADCVFSVVKARKNPYFNMIEERPEGTAFLCKKPNSDVLSRQLAPRVYEMNASIYVYDRKFLLNKDNKTLFSGKTFAYEMDELSAGDIDTNIDFRFLEFLAKEGIVKL